MNNRVILASIGTAMIVLSAGASAQMRPSEPILRPLPARPIQKGMVVAPAAPTVDPQFYVVRQYTDQYGPAAELANGAVYRLINDAPEMATGPRLRPLRPFSPDKTRPVPPTDRSAPAPQVDAPKGRTPIRFMADGDDPTPPPPPGASPPPQISLANRQTAIRNQTGDSCTWFAVTAALEAAYKGRYGLDLDLSEAHFNHLVKINLVRLDTPPPERDNQVGAWGGGHILTNLGFMVQRKMGLPLQNRHPNLPTSEFSSAQPGDDPDIMDWTRVYPQKTFDDYNLGDTPRLMKTPQPVWWTPLPFQALSSARYRATAYAAATDSERQSLDWYRAQLAAGREVVIQYRCCNMLTASGPALGPDGPGPYSHASILVGYDDSQSVFLLKNSWGENGFWRYHYDNVTSGYVQAAGVITDVLDPNGAFTVEDNPQAYVGRWLMTDAAQIGVADGDGVGELDLYVVPRQGTSERLGTYFAQNGQAFRVNGQLFGRVLEIYIDGANPDQPSGQWSVGDRYQFILYEDSRAMMAGRAANRGASAFTRGVVARKVAALPFNPVSRPAPPTPSTVMSGIWNIELEGERAQLVLDRYDASRTQFSGRFQIIGGSGGNAWAVVNGDRVSVWTDQNTLRIYNGAFANASKTVIAGHLGGNPKSAFVGVLRGFNAVTIPAVPGTLGPAAPGR